jgi:cyclopropane fatty-acyl-phospholipid synthase-like methyltransferase
MVAQGYEALGEDYLAWAAQIVDDPRDSMLEQFAARLEPGARVLDLGCGAGIPSTRALATRFAVTGVDISTAQVEAARRNVPAATFLQADLAQVDFPAGSFEGVAALYSIPHVPRDEHSLLFQRIARWLVPGGFFMATLGSDDNPGWINEWLGQPMFFSNYDADSNRRLVATAGFELVSDEILDTIEPEGAQSFLWILARRL